MPSSADIEWLSTQEASRRLGITTRTLYRFVDQGDLPAYRMGRVIRLKATDIDAFIEGSRIEPGTLEHLYPDTSAYVPMTAVVQIEADDSGSLTSSREVTLVVAVPSGDAVAAVVHALRTGDVTVVRSTFAEPTTDEPLSFDGAPSAPSDPGSSASG